MSQHSGRRISLLSVLTLAIAAFAWLAAQPGSSAAHPGHAAAPSPAAQEDDLKRTRDATRRFRNVAVAREAGYRATGECAQDPKYGGMGIHYANPDLISDGELDVTKPEILVYQPMPSGKLRLGAVEYFAADADQDLATDPDRPSLFGMPFDGPMLGHEPGMPVHYDLHVWLYRHNPAGRFAMWNPRVHCPSGSEHAPHAASASGGGDVQIYKKYGYVEFKAYGEVLRAVDSFGDGRGVRAYLNWGGSNSASVTDNGFDGSPKSRNLSIPEGTKVSLTMCYTKKNVDVSCSDYKLGEA